MVCSAELKYHGSTSSMIRHYTAKHGAVVNQGKANKGSINLSYFCHRWQKKTETQYASASHFYLFSFLSACLLFCVLGDRKRELDEALVNMLVKDSQPFSIVDDCGFKEFVALLDPTYTLPSKQTLKDMVIQRYKGQMSKIKAHIEDGDSDLDCWYMDRRQYVSWRYVDETIRRPTMLLGVAYLPEALTGGRIAAGTRSLMKEWGIEGKVALLIWLPDRSLNLRCTLSFVLSLVLVVRNSLDASDLGGFAQKHKSLSHSFKPA